MFAEISCGIPPSGTNTRTPSGRIVYQEVYNYVCEEGFETNDFLSTECLANGSFSLVNLPNCASEFISCTKIIHSLLLLKHQS